MIEYEKLRETVATGLSEYLGCPVVRSNQNEAPPNYPYVSYTITTLLSQNNGTYGVYDDGKERKPFTQTWSITVQSDNNSECVALAIKAQEWLDRVGKVYLDDNNVIVQSVGSITNRDNFITTGYEYRNGFDVVFWLMNELEYETEKIETMELKNKEVY